MGRVYYRPLYSVDYGSVETVGGGVVLGDNDDGTFKRYFEESGSISVYGPFTGVGVPGGREVIAVRDAHRQRNTGFAGLYNGWVMSFLRINNKRQNVTKAYTQDGYIDGGREIVGPPLYKKDFVPWTNAEISTMSTEAGAATGDIGPNTDNRWCVCSESYIHVVYDDDVPVPDTPYPANGATISTSSVGFSGEVPAPQSEQPVRAVFQVSRVNTFDDSTVKNFIGGLNSDTSGTSRSFYVSEIGKDSYTDLGPGVWFLRMKGRDYRGESHESAWGATTSFTITHGALPVPSLSAPAPGGISPTPYGTRSAVFTTAPTGDRYVGAGWRFSKVSDFSSGVVSWTNNKDGLFYTASPTSPATISYNPQPDPEVAPGLNSSKVSFEDQVQYLPQGVWYAQVRAVDRYGQTGAWSSNFTFTVSHPPVVANPIPRLGAAFDKNTDPVLWTFTDPWDGDQQTAYQMKVYDGALNLLQDTGKILQQPSQATMVFAGHLEETLSYKLKIWDLDDVASVEVTNTFKLSTSPVVTVPYPAVDEQIISGQPTITWSVVFATGLITQKSYRIKFIQRSNGNVVYDTGTVVSTATSWTPPRAILKNLIGYQMQVTIVDSQDLDGIVNRNFSTNFIRPDGFFTEIDGSNYQENGYVLVRWPDAVPDGFFAEWRIYRRIMGETEWDYVATVEDVDARSYNDWTVSGNSLFEYAVTQVAYRFGSLVESEFDEGGPHIQVYSDNYWLIDPTDEANNFRVSSVTADKFAMRQQTNEFVIIGGGKRVNYGTFVGKEGSLSVAVRDNIRMTGAEIIRKLNTIFRLKRWLLLRDPFGGITKISIGEVNFTRMPGVGNAEYGDLEIPYSEVGATE